MAAPQYQYAERYECFLYFGFGNELTNAFDSISAAIDGSGGAFEMFGHIAGKIVEGATDAFTELHDTVILTFRIIEYYAAKMGISGEQIKAWGKWQHTPPGWLCSLALFTSWAGLSSGFSPC
jgi:hypothetical protein